MELPGQSFLKFCETLERVAGTSSKNEKVKILSDYFITLKPEELASVCRFILGKESEYGKTGLGWSTIYSAIKEVMNVSQEEIRQLYLDHGDLGEVVKELFEKKPRHVSLLKKELSISDVQEAMDQIASIQGKSSSEMKRKKLAGLLLSSSPIEAKYLIKIITNELRIGATEGIVLDAIGSAFGVKSVRDWYLVLGDAAEVAMRIASGERKRPEPVLFRPVSFMLALPVNTPEEASQHFGKSVFAEFKYDGIRLQGHVSKESGKVILYSRRMEDISASMPELVESLSSLGSDVILDGEVVPFKGGKPMHFIHLQKRLHRKKIDEELLREVPLHYFVFDVLSLNGKSMLDTKLEDRRKTLQEMLSGSSERIHFAESFIVEGSEQIEKLFRRSREEGYEGLVLKDPESYYTPGRRGGAWVKLKEELDTLDVVVMMAEYGNGKRAGMLSDLTFGVWDEGRPKAIGKAYSGLTDEEIKSMTERLKKIKVKELWNGVVVRPEIVLEVAFDSVQKSDRHESGFALRFPRIKRIREDKGPEQADTLERVKEIYNKQRAANLYS